MGGIHGCVECVLGGLERWMEWRGEEDVADNLGFPRILEKGKEEWEGGIYLVHVSGWIHSWAHQSRFRALSRAAINLRPGSSTASY
jgi:hypothetical protein